MIWPPHRAPRASGTGLHGVPHSPPRRALHRAPRGSPLSSPACSPPRGGNCTNRDATRRRHAVAMRLMVQNPHLLGGFRGAPRGSRRAPRGGCRVPARSLGSALSGRCDGGNCTNRDATRRRHAVAMRLMVQNPHPPRALPMARSAILPAALPTESHGVPRRAPRRSPPCPTGFPTLLPTVLPTALHGWGSCARVRPETVDNPRNIKETCHVPRPRLTQVGAEWGSSGIERSSSHAECVLDFLHFSPREFFVGNMPKVP